jgi:hypothetical protein
MAMQTLDLWSLVRGRPQIDPRDLAEAIVNQVAEDELDYRTRLLIRDSVEALKSHWGVKPVERWLAESPLHDRINTICNEEHEKVGFPSIKRRLMEKTDPETIEQYFRELSRKVHKRLHVSVGGSITLIATGLLSRHTDDIDFVDEVPKELRDEHAVLDDLHRRYGLLLGHFQQHYLPSGWANRLTCHKTYGEMAVYFVDPIDTFLGKLTSKRTKDLDDLRVLARQLDKAIITQRLKDTMQSALALEELKENARQNWYILYGEELTQ